MNLKESFRYQKFLDGILQDARESITDYEHALKVTKTHLRSQANAEAEDKTEEVEVDAFFANDDVIRFMQYLIEQKQTLCCAIGKAKAACEFDIDAAVETNKYRQMLSLSIKAMLRYTASKRTERGTDFKFNIEGNQVEYSYDVEVAAAEAYDRGSAKSVSKDAITKSDEVSRSIDMALINTMVDYDQPFDVNDSFEDVMSVFLAK